MDYLLVILATVATIFGGKAFWDWKKNRTPHLDLEELEADRAEYLQENFEKALADFKYIEESRKKISDRELSSQIEKMQRVAGNLISNLEKHPERISLAYKFIDYYQDRAVKIIQQYQELEATGLSTDRVLDLKDKMKLMLSSLDAAYEEQFEHVLNDQIISADAELTVMEQQLDAEGIKRHPVEVGQRDQYDNVRIDTDLLDRPLGGVDTSNLRNMPVSASTRREGRDFSRVRYTSNRTREIVQGFPENKRPEIIERKLIQSALAIFLGTIGAHKFYQGKTFQGILYILFCWTSFPTWISFIEGVRYLFMPVEDFYFQYMDKDRDRR
ncbi:MAG: 5-bromo-4-chloroindolyl phosphate hydrolysis family protein [Selenomonadaceae bacterium]|nr:5-bromo-4-chloroindolyl phosphate hydrolysis family protein [Selenomonadaceae bacterium]